MKFFKSLILILMTLYVTSCSTMTVNYEANLEVNSKGAGKFSAIRTVPNKMYIPCIITGIFYGGACWANLLMPTNQQRMDLFDQMRSALDNRLGSGTYNIVSEKMYRSSWSATLSSEKLEFFQGATNNKYGNRVNIAPDKFEASIPDRPSSNDNNELSRPLDRIPESWPQMYYYETDEYRYWTISGDLKNKQTEALISSQKKAVEVIETEFPPNMYKPVKFETTHIEVVKVKNRFQGWRIIRVRHEDIVSR